MEGLIQEGEEEEEEGEKKRISQSPFITTIFN